MTNLDELLQLLVDKTDMKSVTFCCEGSHMSFDACSSAFGDDAGLVKIDAVLDKHYTESFSRASSRFFNVPYPIRGETSSWVKAIRAASETGKEAFGELTIALRD